ncbi:MFS transporter [bacterium]|nr:MFS transporter [bacterium]
MTSKLSWKFPGTFWTANTVELFERAAYYGVFIAMTLYLSDIVGFDDIDAAWISGFFSAGTFFLPPFTGAIADKIGFRKSILLAFSLLSVGYFSLGALPYKTTVIPSIIILMFGASFIKAIITGTVAQTTDTNNRARAYSIFYAMVNIGSFSGKTIAYPLRINLGLESINYFSAALCFVALIVVFFFYKNFKIEESTKTLPEVWHSFLKVVTNVRLLMLIVIVTGFWIIQQQMYATMPKYVLRTVGNHASPEWISNVNPLVVMTSVLIVTHWMKNVKAIVSMNVGMLLMPISALLMASSPILYSIYGNSVPLIGSFAAHPVTIMLIAGIVVQALAESFISPRYFEFFSLQAPKGEEGLYLGFGHLHSFLASILGFGLSGYLLTIYCPDPHTLTPDQMATAYLDANYIWYYFAVIGLLAAAALFIYEKIVSKSSSKA